MLRRAKTTRYAVVIQETNDIAGEVVTVDVAVFECKSLFGAREHAEKLWKGRPPAGAKIVDLQDRSTYPVSASFPEIL